MNIAVLIVASLASAGTFSQGTAKKVTFSESAGSAEHVIADLSRAAGVKMAVNDPVSREVILVSVKDASLDLLLAKIAKAASGRWINSDGVYVLVEDSAARQAERDAEFSAKTEDVKKVFEGWRKQAEVSKAAGTDTQVGIMPGERGALAEKLIEQVDPALIASMSPTGRLVFSTNPTRTQMPLEGLTQDDVREAIKNHNSSVEAAKKEEADAAAKAAADPQTAQAMDALKSLNQNRWDAKKITGAPVKVLLVIENQMMMPAATGTVRFYDSNGDVEYTEQATLSDFSAMQTLFGAAENKEVPKPPVKSQPIKLSPFSAEMAGWDRSDLKMPKPSAELTQRLLHPETYDPLSFAPSDGLLSIAQETGDQVVADLPDTVAQPKPGETTAAYLGELSDNAAETVVSEKDGWLAVRPAKPDAARKKRMDRAALSDLVNAAHSKGAASLDDLANFALRTPNPIDLEWDGFIFSYVALFAPQMFSDVMNQGDWTSLQFYGTLNAQQRQTLASGGALAPSSLSADQAEILKDMVYGSGARLEVLKPGEAPNDIGDLWLAMTGPFSGSRQNSYLQEPTEACPNGLPSDLSISDKITRMTAVKPAGDAGFLGMLGVVGPTEYALFQMIADFASKSGYAGGAVPKMDKFVVGSRLAHRFAFKLRSNVLMQKALNDDSVPPDGPVVGAGELPKDFLDQAKAKAEELEKSPFGGLGVFLNQRQALPPP